MYVLRYVAENSEVGYIVHSGIDCTTLRVCAQRYAMSNGSVLFSSAG